MACCFEASAIEHEVAELATQARVRQRVSQVFGRSPESIRVVPNARGEFGLVCFVRIRFGIGDLVEFVFADGQLIGIPPKPRGNVD